MHRFGRHHRRVLHAAVLVCHIYGVVPPSAIAVPYIACIVIAHITSIEIISHIACVEIISHIACVEVINFLDVDDFHFQMVDVIILDFHLLLNLN